MTDTLDIPQPAMAKTVCGGEIKDTSKYPKATYRGEEVYFCISACLCAFEKDPDLFMSGAIDHPLDED